MHYHHLFQLFFCQNLTECVQSLQFQCKITLGVCKFCSSMHIMQEITLFLGKIYTAGKNFTRPPVLTVATNLNSANDGFAISFSHLCLVIYQHVKVEIPLWQPLHCFQSIALGLSHSRVRPAFFLRPTFFCDQLFAFLK